LDLLANAMAPNVPTRTQQATAQATSRALASSDAKPAELLRRGRETIVRVTGQPSSASNDALLISVIELLATAADPELNSLIDRCTTNRDPLFARQLQAHLGDVARRLGRRSD
jgi:hypothetical protein